LTSGSDKVEPNILSNFGGILRPILCLTTSDSAVNGRNLPFSCWMRLVEHDCSISEGIIHLCLPPENGVGEGRWTLGVIHYLSGRGLIDENNPNLPSITPNLLAKTFIEFNKDQYQPNLPPGSEIQGRRYPEDPHPVLSLSLLFLTSCLFVGVGSSPSHSSYGAV
jgi:hypothetical protein